MAYAVKTEHGETIAVTTRLRDAQALAQADHRDKKTLLVVKYPLTTSD